MSEQTKPIIAEISNNVQAIGRRINSSKNDREDLLVLAEALETSASTLRTLSFSKL